MGTVKLGRERVLVDGKGMGDGSEAATLIYGRFFTLRFWAEIARAGTLRPLTILLFNPSGGGNVRPH